MATIKGSRLARYTPGNPPASPAELPRWMREELERLADSMQSPAPMASLDVSYKATDRLPSDRVPIVYADGTRWNPGYGAGVYAYYSGAWRLLGSGERVQALTDSATISVDASLANNFRVTLGGNRTLANPTNLTDGKVINIRIKQDGTGARTLAYGSKYKFPGGTAPVLSTAAGSLDFMSCQYDATDDTLVCVLNKAFA